MVRGYYFELTELCIKYIEVCEGGFGNHLLQTRKFLKMTRAKLAISFGLFCVYWGWVFSLFAFTFYLNGNIPKADSGCIRYITGLF